LIELLFKYTNCFREGYTSWVRVRDMAMVIELRKGRGVTTLISHSQTMLVADDTNYFTKPSSFSSTPGAPSQPVRLSDLKIDKDQYLGTGAYGDVRACLHWRYPELRLAIKSMKKNLSMDRSNRSDIERDVHLLLEHSHICPFIVNCHGYLEGEDKVHLIMEQMDTCFRKVLVRCHETERVIPKRIVVAILHGLCSAIKYLHDNDLMHRDIKPANLLFNEDGTMKLADFGKARMLGKGNDFTVESGTQRYYAPERFGSSYNEKCDIWPVGLVAIELLTLEHPILKHKAALADSKTTKGLYWVSKQIADNPDDIFHLPSDDKFKDMHAFVDLCMIKNYKKRPGINDLMGNSIFIDSPGMASQEELASWYTKLNREASFGDKLTDSFNWMLGRDSPN